MEQVILVDENDRQTGLMEKMEAHQKGLLHRAFSVLLFNSQGQLMLQKRARTKYHSGGLWTNTCCSHPLPGETMQEAARRKLMHEMGIEPSLSFAFKFTYEATLDNNLIEHEIDHVFFGHYDAAPMLNPEEAEDWKFVSMASLRADVEQHPSRYTAWFKIILEHPQLLQIG